MGVVACLASLAEPADTEVRSVDAASTVFPVSIPAVRSIGRRRLDYDAWSPHLTRRRFSSESRPPPSATRRDAVAAAGATEATPSRSEPTHDSP